MNPKQITSGEWWTLAIGAAVIIIIFLLMLYTGSTEPSVSITKNNTSSISNQSNISMSTTTPTSSASVAEPGDTVTVNYTGMLADGTVFDSSASHSQPFSFTLGAGQVIPGWDKGVVGMKVGETKTLVIPPADAYGVAGVKNPGTGKYLIPPNATLTFKITVVSIEAPASK